MAFKLWPFKIVRWLFLVLATVSLLTRISAHDASASVSTDNNNNLDNNTNNQTCEAAIHQVAAENCGLWVAKSTLPGAGIGMFGGKAFARGDYLGIPDHTVPMVDIAIHHTNVTFHWEDYYWNANFLKCGEQGTCGDIGYEVYFASGGFGATANSFLDFVNVQVDYEIHPYWILKSRHGDTIAPPLLHRSKDPGVGAFSPYQLRSSTAWQNIEPGDELFVNYGANWFHKRRKSLGPIPIAGDHDRAEELYQSFQKLKDGKNERIVKVFDKAWETFVVHASWKSRIIAALPNGKEEYNEMERIGLVHLKKRRMRRSKEWLYEHAVCADHIIPGKSTLPQAGNGAFAARRLPAGTLVLPIPLLPIPDRSLLDMYELEPYNFENEEETPRVKNKSKVVGEQLLLNYCFGHAESTMLLSAYGPMINFVNHNQSLANVRLQWASPERSNHDPEWLEKEVWQFESAENEAAKVAMELVAIRDIAPGQEIFLDYGSDWEKAWRDHVQNWKPVPGANKYETAEELNQRNGRLRTRRQLESDPYPDNMVLKFDVAFADPRGWKTAFYAKQSLQAFKEQQQGEYVSCEVLKYANKYGLDVYSVAIFSDPKDPLQQQQRQLIKEAPREAFLFHEVPYTDDIFLANAFRHEIRIPDSIFPEKWKNRRNKR